MTVAQEPRLHETARRRDAATRSAPITGADQESLPFPTVRASDAFPDAPDAGWQEAVRIAADRSGTSSDPIVRAAVVVLREQSGPASCSGLATPSPWYPAVREAIRLAGPPTAAGLGIECAVLAAAPIERTCAALAITPDIFRAYGRLFFNVASIREARTRMHLTVLRHRLPADPYLAGVVRTARRLSLQGGPGLVEALLPALPGLLAGPQDPPEIVTEADRMATQVRLMVAVECPGASPQELRKLRRTGLIRGPRSQASRRRNLTREVGQLLAGLMCDPGDEPLRRPSRRSRRSDAG